MKLIFHKMVMKVHISLIILMEMNDMTHMRRESNMKLRSK